MPEKNTLSLDVIHQAQIEEVIKSQDGILGIPIASIPGTTAFVFAGWYFRRIPRLVCGSNQIITLPDVFDIETFQREAEKK